MKWIDLPPVWLGVFVVLVWGMGQMLPTTWVLVHPVASFLGGLLVGAGLVLMLLAALAMRRHRTTIMPHQEAAHLVTDGVFRFSRNPIYLGDVLILAGLILRWGVVPGWLMLPVFVVVLTRRFILPEEDRLRRRFRAEFARYVTQTRRWL
jgi:protein-S-isoprenylcysteine O-methyltransferase Ste14